MHWNYEGVIFSRNNKDHWDSKQCGGYCAFPDIQFGGSNQLMSVNGNYYMAYLGGYQDGYETDPLQTGMAYPCGGKNCDERVADIIKNNTIIKYARTIDVTKSFEPFDDLFQYKGTL